jgi:hypothetical protein
MKTRIHGFNLADKLHHIAADVEALQLRLAELGDQVEELQHRSERQVYRLANRVAHLEAAVPACRIHLGS